MSKNNLTMDVTHCAKVAHRPCLTHGEVPAPWTCRRRSASVFARHSVSVCSMVER